MVVRSFELIGKTEQLVRKTDKVNIERISKEIIKQNEEIELFNNDTVLSLAQMILCEAQELVEATEQAFITDDLTSVALESADVLYLLVRLFDELGIDERAVEIKIQRNEAKYKNQTDKEEARRKWKEQGGDEAFMERYIDNLED